MSVPRTHLVWGHGGTLCGRRHGLGWRFTTRKHEEVTCKLCLAKIRADKLDEEYDP